MSRDGATGDDPADARLLVVDELSRRFADVNALNGVKFHVDHGEFVGLLGPNGAGKTTLIRSICGRVRAARGPIQFCGRPLSWERDRRHIGVIPQDMAIYPDLSAEENLSIFARLHGVPRKKISQTVEWALEWTGLEDRRRHLVGTFSGGMKRRVNIACGVLHQPKLVLLDEPTVGVDPQSREKIFDMLDEMRKSGTALLLTTHHIDEAEERCDRIVIMDHGRVIAEGPFRDLIHSTVGPSSYVALRLSSPVSEATLAVLEKRGVVAKENGVVIETMVRNLATGLPKLIEWVNDFPCEIVDVQVRSPSLQSVFIHLTGRELRE